MCGIVAIWRLDGQPANEAALVAMRDAMVHRGPDDAGLYLDGPVGLGLRRLSIVDLSPAGHQPMCNEDGSVWLVFNGEIYNYVELAAELRERGHQFRSTTDSEVIIHLWEEMGERCVERLNGMFAFVVWDRRRQEMFGARDRIGIKPFQYYLAPDRFIAASEIKVILEDPAVARRPDYQGLSDYLFSGYPLGDKTCFAGIRQLPPGWALSIRDGRLRTWQYWDVRFDYDRGRSLDDTTEQLADLLNDAVRIHCRSDVPLGCHLSGGLDSSTVTALATRHTGPLKTFSIRFDGDASYDESPYARSVARHVGSTHFESTAGPDTLLGWLGALAWHADMPLMGSTNFSYYAASRLAADHVKVALTGHGGDELFAGYPAQFQAAFGTTSMFDGSNQSVQRTPLATRARIALRRYGLVGAATRLFNRKANQRPHEALSALWMRLHCSAPPLESRLLRPSFRRNLGGYDSRTEYLAPLLQAGTDQVLDRCLYHDLRSYLPGLLHQEDRASMAMSLESRVPLLDHRIVEFLATVPPEQKAAGQVPKALLRRVGSSLLPREVVARRDKGAFRVPAGQWFAGRLGPVIERLVFSPAAADRGIFDPIELRSGWHGPAALWSALGIEIWFRIFIDRDPEWLAQIGPADSGRPAGAASTPLAPTRRVPPLDGERL